MVAPWTLKEVREVVSFRIGALAAAGRPGAAAKPRSGER
jgi:hypothetical protein